MSGVFILQNIYKTLLKGTIISLIFTLLTICLFGLIITIFNIPNTVIKPVNLLFKILAIFIGAFFSISEDKGLVKGILLGLLVSVICFIVFGLISNTSIFTLNTLWEVLLSMVVGAVSGIISVNVKGKIS